MKHKTRIELLLNFTSIKGDCKPGEGHLAPSAFRLRTSIAFILVLLLSIARTGFSQRITVKDAIGATRNGITLTRGTQLDLTDSVYVNPGGAVALTTEHGLLFYIPGGLHGVRTFYEKKLTNLSHHDSLQMRLSDLGVLRCDSIKFAERKPSRSLREAMPKEEAAPIQATVKISGKNQIELSWKEAGTRSYYVVAMDLMEELQFVQEVKTTTFAFNGTAYPNLLVRIVTTDCLTSKYLVFRQKNGQVTEVR